jgi:peptide/nickel transport system permease protein
MRGYVIKRTLATIPVMAVVAVFVFGLLRLTPGDPAAVIAGDYANPKDVERIREKLGLNEPLYTQFGLWMSQLSRGDLGTSIFSGLPVTELIVQRLEPTMSLTVLTMIIAISVAIPLGTLAAWKSGTWVDRGVMVFAVLGFSLPVFWLGFLLIYAFAVQLPILPVQGYVGLSQGLLPFLKHLILPALTLGLVYTALIARMTRASLIEVLQEGYVRTAYAKGVRSGSVRIRHALKNA